MPETPHEATLLLRRISDGDETASADLLPLVYDELRALAGAYFARQRPDHTLQPTALVHEAYLRLVARDEPSWRSRAHFMAVAAKAMRRILMNHARDRDARKRGRGWERVTLDAAVVGDEATTLDLVALDDALQRLGALSPRQLLVVELRFFGGLTVPEVAEVLGVGRTTVEADWRLARAWLGRELDGSGGAAP